MKNPASHDTAKIEKQSNSVNKQCLNITRKKKVTPPPTPQLFFKN